MADTQSLLHTVKSALDVKLLIHSFGYPGIFGIVFAETGLMLGFFLPGDSLLITAGIFASKGTLSILVLIPLLFVAATSGNLLGYEIGRRLGKKLFQKEDSRFFHKEHLAAAQAFYNKHGGRAIILARFIPIIRTFAPVVAGITEMEYKTFTTFTIIGSVLWAIGITLAGYFLGKVIPDKYFEPIVLLVIFLSLTPGLYELVKTRENRQKLLRMLTRRSK